LVVGPITGHPVYPMLFAAVLLHLVKERDNIRSSCRNSSVNLQARDLVGLDVDFGVHPDPAAPDLPLPPHPLAPVRDLDPGTVDGDDHVSGEEFGLLL